jgi:hypothetical protein
MSKLSISAARPIMTRIVLAQVGGGDTFGNRNRYNRRDSA